MSTSKSYLKDMLEFVTLIVAVLAVAGLITCVLYLIAGELGDQGRRWAVVVLSYAVGAVGFLGYRLGRAYRDGVRDSMEMHGTLRTATPAATVTTIDNAPPPVERLPLYPSTFEASGVATDALLAKIRAFEDAGIDSEMPQR
jgi:hypothetical protein